MTRKELISSKEYIEANLEILISSKKPISEVRKDMAEFILNHREEYAKEALSEIDLELSKAEDWMHGEEGTAITKIRSKITEIIKELK